jgi:hypothetical protein
MYLLVFHAYFNEVHGSRSKIPSKNLFRQRCAEGFNFGVKMLMNVHCFVPKAGVEPTHESHVLQTAAIGLHNCGVMNQLLSLFPTLQNQNCSMLSRGLGVAIWWWSLLGQGMCVVRLASVVVRAKQLSDTKSSIMVLNR